MRIPTMATAVALASMQVVAAAQQQPGSWFPPGMREGLARELTARLEHIDIGIAKADLLPVSRRAAAEMGLRLDTIGVTKLIELAPRFPRLDLPLTGDQYLDAMARLGLCTYYLEARYAEPSAHDQEARLDAALGPMALALATGFLREPYLRQGGTDETIKVYLAGDPLNAVVATVVNDPELLRYTAGECRGVVSALLD